MLLQPEQHTVPSILDSILFPKAMQDLKLLMLTYFETSAEASRLCSHLLSSINQAHYDFHFIKEALEKINDGSSIQETNLAVSQLVSFTLSDNPLSNTDQHEFKLMQDRYTAILHQLKSKKKKVARRMKFIHGLKTVAGVCLIVACSVLALVAVGIDVHSLSGLLMGPALLGCTPFVQLKKKFSMFRLFRSRFLRRLMEQLDAAAKGTYILNRDFDTVSRLVSRLHDEFEHNKMMIKFCLERRNDRVLIEEVVKELKKCGRGLEQQIEELEEHVFLCLVTINRARLLVINEISKPQP